MVRGGHIAVLERLSHAIVEARAHGNSKMVKRLNRWCAYLVLDERYGSLRSPRVRYHSSHFAGTVSFWSIVRSKNIPSMFVRFLGFPPALFYDLTAAMRPFLRSYDHALSSSAGRCTTLDYIDVTAVALRRLQINGPVLRFLEQDFGLVASVLSGIGRALEAGRVALHEVLTRGLVQTGGVDLARVCYPSFAEGSLMWKGLVAQHGYPPFTPDYPVLTMMDGTTTLPRPDCHIGVLTMTAPRLAALQPGPDGRIGEPRPAAVFLRRGVHPRQALRTALLACVGVVAAGGDSGGGAGRRRPRAAARRRTRWRSPRGGRCWRRHCWLRRSRRRSPTPCRRCRS